MEESIRLLLEEAKNGIMTVSDFYAPEILAYFYAKAIMGIILGLILMCAIIFIFICKKKEWFWDDGYDNSKEVSEAGTAVYVFTLSTMIAGFIVLCFKIYNIIMLLFVPKIYITEHLLHMF